MATIINKCPHKQLNCHLTPEKLFQGIFYTEEAAKEHAQQVLDAWIKGLDEEREGK